MELAINACCYQLAYPLSHIIIFTYMSGLGEYATTCTKYHTIIVHELCCKYATGVVHATVSEYDYHVVNNIIIHTHTHIHNCTTVHNVYLYSIHLHVHYYC